MQASHTPSGSDADRVEFHLNSDSEDEEDHHSENPSEESSYDLDLHSYQPIQPMSSEHGVMLVSPKFSHVPLHELQTMHHGCTAIHCDASNSHSMLVYLKLESDNGTLSWCKPHWSALRGNTALMPDYAFFNEHNQKITPGLSSRYLSGLPVIDDLDEGHIDLDLVKEVRLGESGVNTSSGGSFIDLASICKRHGLCGSDVRAECNHITLIYGSSIAESHALDFVLPITLASIWLRALRRLVRATISQRRKHCDRRLQWLKHQYLQLYFESAANGGDKCHGPTPAEAIKVSANTSPYSAGAIA